MIKGQIFWARDSKKHKHPIVFLETEDEEKFLACILSTKDTNGNKLMSASHFENRNEKGNEHNIQFKNSHLVPSRIFIKEISWLRSLDPQGMLTEDGIRFIESYLDDVTPEFLPISIKDATELNMK